LAEPGPDTTLKSDLNKDNKVDSLDLITLLREWGQGQKPQTETHDGNQSSIRKDPPVQNRSRDYPLLNPNEDDLDRSQPSPPIFSERPVDAGVLPQERVLRQGEPTLDFRHFDAALRGDTEILLLNLFDDVVLEAIVQRRHVRSEHRYSLSGYIKGERNSRFIFTVRDGYLLGKIQTQDGRFYQMRRGKSGVAEVRELDTQQGFVCTTEESKAHKRALDAVLGKDRQRKSSQKAVQNCSGGDYDDGTTFDILVVYTPWARCAEEGGSVTDRNSCLSAYPTESGAIETMIDLSIDEMNECFDDSNMNPVAALVHQHETNYTEVSISTDLTRVRTPSDSHMDEVPIIRDYYHADMVILIANYDAISGLASGVPGSETEMENFAESAYCAIDRSVGGGTNWFVFHHELGHLMGCAHETAADPT